MSRRQRLLAPPATDPSFKTKFPNLMRSTYSIVWFLKHLSIRDALNIWPEIRPFLHRVSSRIPDITSRISVYRKGLISGQPYIRCNPSRKMLLIFAVIFWDRLGPKTVNIYVSRNLYFLHTDCVFLVDTNRF